MLQLSGLDSMFFHIETDELPMHISSCTVFAHKKQKKGSALRRVGFEEIKTVFKESLLPQVPILTCRVKPVWLNLDQPYWVEDKHFDLDYHLRHIALPKPGDWDALRELCAKLHARPLNAARPLWEVYIIDGLDNIEGYPKESFAMYMKVHHAIMDGRTGMNIMTSLLSFAPDQQPIGSPAFDANELVLYEQPGMMKKLGRGYMNNLRKSARLTRLIASDLPRALGRFQSAKASHEMLSIEKREKTRFNKTVSGGRTLNRILLPLDEIKQIRKVVEGATVNDVLLTVIGGAIYSYLENLGETPVHSLVAGAPVDVRDENDDSVQGNLLTFMTVSLCSDIADPVERLAAVHQASVNAKLLTEQIGSHTLVHSLDAIYPGITALGLRTIVDSGLLNKFDPVANTIVSNIPTIPMSVYLAGAELIDNFGIGPLLPNVGLFHVISGINNTITLAFSACSKAMPDSELYAACLRESYQKLRDSALE